MRETNEHGARASTTKAVSNSWGMSTISVLANVKIEDKDVLVRLHGKRGGNRYDQSIVLSVDGAEQLGRDLLWMVDELRGTADARS